MKKKIINGLLFAVALVAATSSFVSCKDYNGDNYAELQEKYLTLQAAFEQQVDAMGNYVLLTESGWTRNELATKTIKDRLAQLGIDVNNYTDTQIANLKTELQNWTNQKLADYVTQNELTIGLANTLNSANGYTDNQIAGLKELWGPQLQKAVAAAEVVEANSADWSNTTAEWNNVKGLVNKMLEGYDKEQGGWKAGDEKFATIQDVIDYFYEADSQYSSEIAALKKDLDNLLATLQAQVTGIEIQATYNPIFGTFSYPIGVQSNILAAYYGEFDKDVYFPAGDLDDGVWANEVAAVLNSELQAIGAPEEKFEKGIQMVEGAGNAGKLYVTVNPSDVVMDGKEFTLRASDNSVSKVALSPLETSTEQLKWGYNRAASANGFYVATAQIKKEDANDVALSFNLKGLASEIKDIMNNWSSVNASDIAKLALAVHDGMKVNVPRLGVQAQWKDELGWKNYVSKYDVAAFSVKPLGFDFLYDQDYSKGIAKFKNKLIAKEEAAAQEFIQEIINMIQINFGLPTTGGNIYVDEATGKIYLRIPAGSVTMSGTGTVAVAAGQFGTIDLSGYGAGTYNIPATNQDLDASITAGNPNNIDMDITPLFDTIAGTIQQALANISGKASDTIHKYLDKIINAENKIFGKLESVAKNPNRFIQPALVGKCEQLGFFYPSRNYLAPTQVKKGQKIMLYPTTLTGEVVAPAYKKYVAVCGAWDVNDVTKTKDAKSFNTGLNTIFNGADYNMSKPIEYTVDAPAGTVLEFIYECLGYNGKVAGKKYYIEVYE